MLKLNNYDKIKGVDMKRTRGINEISEGDVRVF